MSYWSHGKGADLDYQSDTPQHDDQLYWAGCGELNLERLKGLYQHKEKRKKQIAEAQKIIEG